MTNATPSDVRDLLDTGLSDSEIARQVELVSTDIDRAYDAPKWQDDYHRGDFEAALAALRIAEGRDRRASEQETGSISTTYETAAIDGLRKRVRRLDPGDEFGHAGSLVRDSDRTINVTGDDE